LPKPEHTTQIPWCEGAFHNGNLISYYWTLLLFAFYYNWGKGSFAFENDYIISYDMWFSSEMIISQGYRHRASKFEFACCIVLPTNLCYNLSNIIQNYKRKSINNDGKICKRMVTNMDENLNNETTPEFDSSKLEQFDSSTPIEADNIEPIDSIQQTDSSDTQMTSTPLSTPTRKKKRLLSTAIIAILCILLIGSGTLAYTQLLKRDIAILVMGEKNYALSLQQKSMTSVSSDFVKYMSLMLKGGAAAPVSTKTDLKMEVSPDESLYNLMSQSMGDEGVANIKSIIDYVNSLNISSVQSVDSKGSKASIKLSENTGDVFTINSWSDNKNIVVQAPEISNKYVKILMNINSDPSKLIKIDSKKLEASLKSILKVYTDSLKEGKFTVADDQTVKISDVSVTAKKVTITLTEEQLIKLFKAVIKAARDDAYLQEMVVNNANSLMEYYKATQNTGMPPVFNEKLTAQKYKDELNKLLTSLDDVKAEAGTVSLSSYINPQNEVVASTFEILPASSSDTEKITIQMLTPSESIMKSRKAINLSVQGNEIFRAIQTPSSIKDGNIKIFINDPESKISFGINVDYKNTVQLPWNGNNFLTGTYTISLFDADNLIPKSAALPKELMNITDSTMVISYGIDKDTLNSSVKLSLKGIGDLNIKGVTKSTPAGTLDLPKLTTENSFVIDPAKPDETAMAGMTSEMQTGVMKQLLVIAKRNPAVAKILEANGMPVEALEAVVNGGGMSEN
jgi:hypothetical protein